MLGCLFALHSSPQIFKEKRDCSQSTGTVGCAEYIEFVLLQVFAYFEVFFFSTANFPIDVVDNLPEAVSTGIYYGWASVDRGPVYKMVMSIGWNPFYNNTKKSMVGTTECV